MSDYRMKRGYDVPMLGRAEGPIVDAARPKRVGVRPTEFRFVKPKLMVKEGETVSAGQPLFRDRKRAEIRVVAPAGGVVSEIRFGRRKVCQEIFIDVAEQEPVVEHSTYSPDEARQLTRAQIVEILLDSGLWPSLRRRPFSVIPDPERVPEAIFIGAADNDPLPFDYSIALAGREEDFQLGVDLLGKLTEGKVHACTLKGSVPGAISQARNCEKHTFSGPYPAGKIEAQIHYVLPHKKGREVWYLDAQDCADIGEVVRAGRYPVARVVAVAGEGAVRAQYFRTRRAVSAAHLDPDASPASNRFVSGGPLTGVRVSSDCGLGLYDCKFSVIPEGDHPEFVGWMLPGFHKLSRYRAYASAMMPTKAQHLDTNLGGGVRAHVATGIYEDVCGMDILPGYLMKSVLVEDFEESDSLGLADCAECGLCTHVCPSKIEFGEIISKGIVAHLREEA
ncbi:MAG: Na(+)-translocating NADH-quinone reductase subunit A [Gemmatimonadota bacterium]|nr:MAG: Na(+)-translocating NADH-quinone reductase subunit A [Gemmatimonadota bacterium]